MNKVSFRSLVAVFCACGLLAACGNRAKSESSTQVAARVNGDEITVHQVNFALARANVSTPEQMKQASHEALQRLIEQDLLVQAAADKKLDRDPRVVQAIEAAKREVIARAYLEQAVMNAVPKPSREEIRAYYDAHPALFSARRVYGFREIGIQNVPGLEEKLRRQLAKSSSIDDLIAWLKSENVRFADNTFEKPAEQLPLESLNQFQAMKDGDIKLSATPQALAVLQLASLRSEPVDEMKAQPLIEQFLSNQRRAEVVKAEIQRLRAGAKIELVGDFADPQASAVAQVSEPASGAPSGAQSSGLEKGIKGLK